MNIPIGLLKRTRLPFEVKKKKSQVTFSKNAVEKVLEGIQNIILYQDDIGIGARSKELKSKTKQVLIKLNRTGMTINCDKSDFNCKSFRT